jgi:hypothetical protein
MKTQIIPLCILLSLTACAGIQSETSKEQQPVAQEQTLKAYDPIERYSALLWVEKADPVVDAMKSLNSGNIKLWGYNTRLGPKVPGVNASDIEIVLKQHELNLAPAMGDAVYGDNHLKLRTKFVEYAKQYNTEILKNN